MIALNAARVGRPRLPITPMQENGRVDAHVVIIARRYHIPSAI